MEKIEQLLKDESLRIRFTAKGYQKVTEEFNLEREVNKLIAVWKAQKILVLRICCNEHAKKQVFNRFSDLWVTDYFCLFCLPGLPCFVASSHWCGLC